MWPEHITDSEMRGTCAVPGAMAVVRRILVKEEPLGRPKWNGWTVLTFIMNVSVMMLRKQTPDTHWEYSGNFDQEQMRKSFQFINQRMHI